MLLPQLVPSRALVTMTSQMMLSQANGTNKPLGPSLTRSWPSRWRHRCLTFRSPSPTPRSRCRRCGAA